MLFFYVAYGVSYITLGHREVRMSHDALPRKRISAVSQTRKGEGMAQLSVARIVSSRLHLV